MHCNRSAMHCSRQDAGVSLATPTFDVCPRGTQRHLLECARLCAQTRTKNHHSAPNANQVLNKKRAEISKIPARSVMPGSLSKPPPSASRPLHRARKLSINNMTTSTNAIVPTIVPARSRSRARSPARAPTGAITRMQEHRCHPGLSKDSSERSVEVPLTVSISRVLSRHKDERRDEKGTAHDDGWTAVSFLFDLHIVNR